MTSSILITKNLNLLYLSVQALDPYAMDQISKYFRQLDLINLFDNRENNLLKYSSHVSTYNMEITILLASKLFKIASALKFQRQIKLILQELSREASNCNQYSSITQNYINRFQVEYSLSIEPYLVGRESYTNKLWIKKLSFLNLFLLSQLSTPYGPYMVLIYISENTFN